jgi:ankyrin repeat protein
VGCRKQPFRRRGSSLKGRSKGQCQSELSRDCTDGAGCRGPTQNAEILLKAGADPNLRNTEGETALSIAIRNHNGDIAELLKQAGAQQ